jgi:hypothetical protein
MYNIDPHNLSGVTILLSLTVFSQVVTESMPRTSDAMPLLGKNHFPKNCCLHFRICIRQTLMDVQ